MLTDLRMVFWRMTVPKISNGGATRHHGRMCLVLKGSHELEVGPGGVDDTGLWTRCLGCETSHVHDDTDFVTARCLAHDNTVQGRRLDDRPEPVTPGVDLLAVKHPVDDG